MSGWSSCQPETVCFHAVRSGNASPSVELALEHGDELLDHEPAVAHDRHVGAAHLAELGGVDVDVDDLRLGGEGGHLAGDAVVEAAAQGDEQVGPLHRRDRGVVAVHARHAEGQRVAVGEGPAGHEGGDDVDVAQLGQLAQRLGRPRLEDAAAGVDHGALRAQDHLGGFADLAGMAGQRGLVAREAVPHVVVGGPVPLHLRVGVLRVDDVLGDVEQHRARGDRWWRCGRPRARHAGCRPPR